MQIAFALTPQSIVSLVASAHDLVQHCIRFHPRPTSTQPDVVYAVTSDDSELCHRRFSFIDFIDRERCPQPDWILVPALAIAGRWCAKDYRQLVAWLRTAARRGAHIVGVGTGTFLLAEAGLFQRHRAVTYSTYRSRFRQCFPELELVVDMGWLEDDRVICSGDLPWQELLLAEIARHWGDAAARDAARTYALQWNHVIRPTTGQVFDASIALAQHWLAEHHAEENLIARCVERLGLGRRTFNRRFKQETGMSPTEYVQLIRIQGSQRLLSNTRLSVEDISRDVGYSDIGAFYRLFRRYTGISPGQFRRSRANG